MNDKNTYFANVIIDLSINKINRAFTYKIPDELVLVLKIGDAVEVPFGNGDKTRSGYIINIQTKENFLESNFYQNNKFFKENPNAIYEFKSILGKAEKKLGVREIQMKMALFMAREYNTPLATCLNRVLLSKKNIRKHKKQIDTIEKYLDKNDEDTNIVLNEEQEAIVNDLIKKYENNGFSENLLYGITGSGKTEVYNRLVDRVIEDNKTVIILIPEISLTYQTVVRLKKRFNNKIAIIHSMMSDGDKYIQYKKCLDGEAKILVGPRSAVFAPFNDLGLIVMDEVHDKAYIAGDSPRYKTLEVARFRAKTQNAMLLTLSATPNVSYYYEAKNTDNITLYTLTKRARKDANLPSVEIVDMKEENDNDINNDKNIKAKDKKITYISKRLKELIIDRLNKKEQIMIYINRRGFYKMMICKKCGEKIMCPNCDVALTFHNDGKLKCHYCGHEEKLGMKCQNCGNDEFFNIGIGTEQLENLLNNEFKNALILRMDRDTVKKRDDYDNIIERVKNKEADILIGTQMIIKGHDFPNVTLIAIINLDSLIFNDNYDSLENAYASLMQCVGRSGRDKEGIALIQTYDTNSFIIDEIKKQNYEDFYNKEIEFRKKHDYPPFSSLMNIIIKAENLDLLTIFVEGLVTYLNTKKVNEKDVILGPAIHSPEKLDNEYIREITIKTKNTDDAKKYRKHSNDYKKARDKNENIIIIYNIN